MTTRQISLGPARLSVPNDWADITEELEGDNKPYTIADPQDGVGALQLSLGLFAEGATPNPSESDLRAMVLQFSEENNLGAARDDSTFSKGELVGVGMSFHSGDDFIRAWYVSDGKNFVLFTYTCTWGEQERELSLCEEIIQSLQFAPKK